MIDTRQDYLVAYEGHKGPIKLMLDLVQSKKIDIYQISLNEVISGFLGFIKENRVEAIDVISSFIWTASILLEIKSRSLIPSKKKESSQEDPGQDLLIRRERQYRVFKKLSSYLEKIMETEELFYVREAPLEKRFIEIIPDFLEGIDGRSLCLLAASLLKDEPIESGDRAYSRENTRTIFDEMGRIRQELSSKDELTFRELATGFEELIDIIICFLSILELYKNEEIEIAQFENFGSIIIRKIYE